MLWIFPKFILSGFTIQICTQSPKPRVTVINVSSEGKKRRRKEKKKRKKERKKEKEGKNKFKKKKKRPLELQLFPFVHQSATSLRRWSFYSISIRPSEISESCSDHRSSAVLGLVRRRSAVYVSISDGWFSQGIGKENHESRECCEQVGMERTDWRERAAGFVARNNAWNGNSGAFRGDGGCKIVSERGTRQCFRAGRGR